MLVKKPCIRLNRIQRGIKIPVNTAKEIGLKLKIRIIVADKIRPKEAAKTLSKELLKDAFLVLSKLRIQIVAAEYLYYKEKE